ncbi:hypothetical protein Tco_0189591 [Tanacetum coccineum]
MYGHIDIPESHGKMVRWLDEEIPRNRILTLRRDLLGVARFLRWVEAKMKTSFPEMESSGSIVVNIPEIVEDQNKWVSGYGFLEQLMQITSDGKYDTEQDNIPDEGMIQVVVECECRSPQQPSQAIKCYAIIEAIDFDTGFASFVLGDNPILSLMPLIFLLLPLMMCGVGGRTLQVMTTKSRLGKLQAPQPEKDTSDIKERIKKTKDEKKAKKAEVNFPMSPMTRVRSAEREVINSAKRDTASRRLLLKTESHVNRIRYVQLLDELFVMAALLYSPSVPPFHCLFGCLVDIGK